MKSYEKCLEELEEVFAAEIGRRNLIDDISAARRILENVRHNHWLIHITDAFMYMGKAGYVLEKALKFDELADWEKERVAELEALHSEVYDLVAGDFSANWISKSRVEG
jgi:hypothetical protein